MLYTSAGGNVVMESAIAQRLARTRVPAGNGGLPGPPVMPQRADAAREASPRAAVARSSAPSGASAPDNKPAGMPEDALPRTPVMQPVTAAKKVKNEDVEMSN
nr:hypothetical protein B0A51_04279 [Rachicladosporium sp. CCFEE 5018]